MDVVVSTVECWRWRSWTSSWLVRRRSRNSCRRTSTRLVCILWSLSPFHSLS